MLKKLATSVKSAIKSSASSEKTKSDEHKQTNKNVNLIRDRITIEKEIERKNQRLKLITDSRLNYNNNTAKINNDMKLTVPNEPKLKRTNSDLSLNFSSNDTFTGSINSNLDRKLRLEMWRKERKERMLSLKDTQKPVFKVQHLGSKLFDSKSTSDIKSASVSRNSSMLDSSKSGYKFQDSIRHTNHSDTHKMSRQNSTQNLHEGEKYHFGNTSSHSKFVPQFTFTMKVNSSDLTSHNNKGMTISTPLLTAPKTSVLRRHESMDKDSKRVMETRPRRTPSAASDNRLARSTPAVQPLKKETPTLKSTETGGPVTRSKLAELKSKEATKSVEMKSKTIPPVTDSNFPPAQRIAKLKSSNVSTDDSNKNLKTAKLNNKLIKTNIVDATSVVIDQFKNQKIPHYEPKVINEIPDIAKPKQVHSKSRPSDLIKFDDDDNYEIPMVKAQPTIAETSFEDLVTQNKTRQDTVDHVIVRKSVHNLSQELISTPKHSRQKEELENEFKNLNLSVKKAIKHFENLSNSFNSGNNTIQLSAEIEQRVKYFRDLVVTKTNELLKLSQIWTNICNEQCDLIPDSIQGDIRSACGLAKLLIDERFKQFCELIDQCEATNCKNADPEVKVVKCSDLQGFWEMINHQVKDVENQFGKLDKIKENNWSDEFEPVIRAKKTAVRKQSAKPSATTKPAVKSKFAEFRAQLMKSKKEVDSDEPQQMITEQLNLKQQVENPIEIKPTTPEEQKPVKARKRSVIKSRPSDLIKFDSPVPMKRNNLNDVIAENAEDEETNKENDLFDFDTYVPIVWSKNTKLNQTQNNSPITPTRTRVQMNDLVNSPLLKLALVSSHGKSRKSQSFKF